MRKRRFILGTSFALLLLAGCTSRNGSQVEERANFDIQGFIENNLNFVNDLGDESDKVQTEYLGKRTITYTESIVDSTYKSLGLLVRGSSSSVGFYSMTYDKYIIMPSLNPKFLHYEVISDANVGFILKVFYKEDLYVFDSLGNLLTCERYVQGSYITTVPNGLAPIGEFSSPKQVTASTMTHNGNVVVSAGYGVTNSSLLTYDAGGNVFGVGSLQDVPTGPNFEDQFDGLETEDPFFDYGDSYVDEEDENFMDLSMYGLLGYHLAKNSEGFDYWTIFDDQNKKIASFSIPSSAEGIIADGRLFYQESYPVASDATSYSYVVSGEKYDLYTYVINLRNGSISTIDLPYVAISGKSFKNARGIYQYAYLKGMKIESDHSLSDIRELLLDKNLNIIQDVTNFEVDEFIQIDDDHFYNQKNKIIYNSKIEETLYIGAMEPRYIQDERIFIGTVNGLYGAIDADGKTVIPFRYQSFQKGNKTNDYVFQDGYTIAKDKDGSFYRVTPRSDYRKYLGTQKKRLFDDCYLFSDGSKFIVSDYENDYLEHIYYSELSSFNYSIGLGSAEYAFVYADDSCYRFAKRKTLNSATFTPSAVVDTTGTISTSAGSGVTISEGSNSIIIGAESYFKQSNLSSNCLYTYSSNHNMKIEASKTSSGLSGDYQTTDFFYFNTDTGEGNSGSTRYLSIVSVDTYSPWVVRNLELEVEKFQKGDHYLYPSKIYGDTQYTFTASRDVYRYRYFEPETTGTYQISFETDVMPVFECYRTNYSGTSISSVWIDDFTYTVSMNENYAYYFIFANESYSLASMKMTIALA